MKRKGVLLVLGALSLGAVAMAPAPANAWTNMGTGEWTWYGTGNGMTLKIEKWENGDIFGLSNIAKTNTAVLLSNQGLFGIFDSAIIDVRPTGDQFEVAYDRNPNPIAPITDGIVALGSSPIFELFFNDAAVSSSYSYKLYSAGINDWTPPTGFDAYKLEHGGQEVIFTTCNITPTAVPIPGAVVLLGTGLMGLLGIGMRKKSAVSA